MRTATGKEIECDYFNPCIQTSQCNIRVLRMNVIEVAEIFSNPSETEEMVCEDLIAIGYTRLVAIIPESDAIRVVLGKE